MILAWIGAALIGVSLGLLGSGGSILTVPVLVYLVGESSKLAIVESLAIVGLIALVGALPHLRKGWIDGRAVGLFGGPGLLGTGLGTMVGHVLPATLQLLIFAVVMLIAAVWMFQPVPAGQATSGARAWWQVSLAGLGVGILTGVIGVGGGFLILPALVLLLGLSMPRAVGTSLVIVALNSAFGFSLHVVAQSVPLHGHVSAVIAGVGIVGSLMGGRLTALISPLVLRRSFAGVLVVLGGYILATSVPQALHPLSPASTVQHASPAHTSEATTFLRCRPAVSTPGIPPSPWS